MKHLKHINEEGHGNSYKIVEDCEKTKPNSTSRYSREFICKCINNVYSEV